MKEPYLTCWSDQRRSATAAALGQVADMELVASTNSPHMHASPPITRSCCLLLPCSHSFMPSFTAVSQSFIHSFTHSLIARSLARSSVRSFVRSCVRSFIHSLTQSVGHSIGLDSAFIHSFTHSLIQSFIHSTRIFS
jgi:hypothetical protein